MNFLFIPLRNAQYFVPLGNAQIGNFVVGYFTYKISFD